MTRIHALWTLEGLGKYDDIYSKKSFMADLRFEQFIHALAQFFSLPSEKVAALVRPPL